MRTSGGRKIPCISESASYFKGFGFQVSDLNISILIFFFLVFSEVFWLLINISKCVFSGYKLLQENCQHIHGSEVLH